MRFIVIGDWGGLPDFPYRTPVEKAVGREMGKITDYLDTQFVLALGDNFYFDGVKDVADSRFKVSNIRVPTQPGKPEKMGGIFQSGNSQGIFDQTGKVRENPIKYWKIQGISDKYYLLFSSDI